MTTPSKKDQISKILLNNAKINEIKLQANDFKPTNIGHGPFVKTIEGDVLYDLRDSDKRPFCGHSHPILIQHNFKALNNEFTPNFYSVPKTEYTKMIETFQKVHFTEILNSNFEITYHNVVINFDEDLISHDIAAVKERLNSLISKNRSTYFWIIENDINLFTDNDIFLFNEFMISVDNQKHVHLVSQNHFISSVFIYSHHLFSEDENIQFYLSFKKFFEEIIGTEINGKNSIDFEIIDAFIFKNDLNWKRKNRYLIFDKSPKQEILKDNGILIDYEKIKEPFHISIPLACTNDELLDILNKLKISL